MCGLPPALVCGLIDWRAGVVALPLGLGALGATAAEVRAADDPPSQRLHRRIALEAWLWCTPLMAFALAQMTYLWFVLQHGPLQAFPQVAQRVGDELRRSLAAWLILAVALGLVFALSLLACLERQHGRSGDDELYWTVFPLGIVLAVCHGLVGIPTLPPPDKPSDFVAPVLLLAALCTMGREVVRRALALADWLLERLDRRGAARD